MTTILPPSTTEVLTDLDNVSSQKDICAEYIPGSGLTPIN